MQWPQHPYSRIAISFCGGIFVWYYFEMPSIGAYVACSIFSITWIIFEQFYRNIKDQALISSILMLATVFFAGSSIISYHKDRLSDQKIELVSDTPIKMIGTIAEQLNSANNLRFTIKCQAILTDSIWKKHESIIVGIFEKSDSLALMYRVGSHLGLKNVKLLDFKVNTNPDAFDYSKFMKEKGVRQYAFIKNGTHFLISSQALPWYKKLAQHAAQFVSGVINKYLKDGSSIAIAEALLIGKQTDIDGETYQAYAQTGAIHVLSVSGLHVAIFIGGFIWLFGKVRSKNWIWKLSKLILLLMLIWFYVILTGMAPSVVRAGGMISLYLLGSEIFKGKNNYNILSITAIIMLIYNPLYLFQLSFQFSYISLLSILYFQPIIKKWYEPPNQFLDFIWSLVNVSIAAQILIFPFTVYYFHQFPVYFVLSGIIAVPLVSAIIYLGSAGVILEKIFPSFSIHIFQVLEQLIMWLNSIIKWISKLPFALIESIWLTDLMLFLTILMIICVMIWLETRYYNTLKLGLILGLFVLAINTFYEIKATDQQQLVVYDINQGSLVDLTQGRRVHRLLHGDIDTKQIAYVSKNHLIKTKIKEVINDNTSFGGDTNNLTYILRDQNDFDRLRQGIKCEHLIITRDSKMPSEEILAKISPTTVILSKNVTNKTRQKWQNLQQATGICVHDIRTQGAYLYQSQ